MHTGMPAKTAANVAKLVPGYQVQYSTLALVLGIAGTVAWLAWYVGARRDTAMRYGKTWCCQPVAWPLCWLLFLTLWLPVLDQARSYRLLLSRVTCRGPSQRVHPCARRISGPADWA